MSKCIFCKSEKDGRICRHCLAKGSSKASKAVQDGIKVVGKAMPIILSGALIIIAKGKKRN